MDRKVFFAEMRKRDSGLFSASLSQAQVDGLEAILDEAERRKVPLNQAAYILATDYHESAHTMQPVRETLAKSDADAIARLETAWKAGKLPWVKTPYWRKDKDGKAWFGRGLVQITHKDNYLRLSQILGIDLVKDPAKALDMHVALQVMFEGMLRGLFTNRKLSDYVLGTKADFVGARQVVNGKDRASDIAGYAESFARALKAAGYGAVLPPVIKPAPVPSPPLDHVPVEKEKGWWALLISAFLARFRRK